MDVASWLRSLGLEQYEAAFRENRNSPAENHGRRREALDNCSGHAGEEPSEGNHRCLRQSRGFGARRPSQQAGAKVAIRVHFGPGAPFTTAGFARMTERAKKGGQAII